jgi:hypothetical protein
MTQPLKFLILAAAFLATTAQTRVPDPMTTARDLYNQRRFSEAIRAAQEARAMPVHASSAAVVLARSYLERYRQTLVLNDLALAREALRGVDGATLTSRDRVELLIAYGQSLYFDEAYSLDDRFVAAAEQFEIALSYADVIDAPSRDRLFEWWAGALDRQAQQGSESARRPLYERVLHRAEQELWRDASAASASYWLAASARGLGDYQRAMGAAVAGWVRAASLGSRRDDVRGDLDRLMRQVILPERARELASEGDPRSMLTLLEAQWTELKAMWGGK